MPQTVDTLQAAKAFDQLVETDKPSDLLNLLGTLAGTPLQGDPSSAFRTALRTLHATPLETLAAACLIRMCGSAARGWAGEMPWRTILIEAVEHAHEGGLYRAREGRQMQGHLKVDELARISTDAERSLRDAINTLTSLDRLAQHRQALFTAMRSRAGVAVLMPFLPDNIVPALQDLFRRAEEYSTARETVLGLDANEQAVDEALTLAKQLTEVDTRFSRLLAVGVCTKLCRALKQDLAGNPATQPTTLALEKPLRKYPFGQAGRSLPVTLVVRNTGRGYANHVRLTLNGDANVDIGSEPVEIGRLPPGATYPFNVTCRVVAQTLEAHLTCLVEWRDSQERHELKELTLIAQNPNVDWETLIGQERYSLEPVESEEELIGRRDTLNRIVAIVRAKKAGSLVIEGQKRVGKTSLVKALRSRLQASGGLVVYLEAGHYIAPSGPATVKQLGEKLCRALTRADPRLSHLPTPVFSDALSPLDEFLEDVASVIPGARIAVILDEFDQLPLELYSRNELAEAFFLTLRSIGGRPTVSFVLVGGERMKLVVEAQGQHLNKWQTIQVDYFHREKDWADYVDLIQRPVSDALEFSEDAFVELYRLSAGNPYFTNKLCAEVLTAAIRRRDASVTSSDVAAAMRAIVESPDVKPFQHFWDDGILESGELARQKSVRRRKLLIAVSDVLSKLQPAPREAVLEQPLARTVLGAEADLREFVSRKILEGEDAYTFTVPLLREWIASRGVMELIASMGDEDVATKKRQEEAALQLRSEEVLRLVEQWPSYKGQAPSEDRVRAWLEQFGGAAEQRLMFKLLQGLTFVSSKVARGKLGEIKDILDRKVVHKLSLQKRKRDNVLVSYLDGAGKSGSSFASAFADETGIYVDNVVEKGRLNEQLIAKKGIDAVVFVDDFVGTGESASGQLRELAESLGKLPSRPDLLIVYGVLVGFKEGWSRVQTTVAELSLKVEVHCCTLLDESARCFSPQSATFPDPDERERARSLAERHGRLLQHKWPLGFRDSQAAVVFESGCPNNTLPILWAQSAMWRPLFKRL